MTTIPSDKTVVELRALGYTAAQLYAAGFDRAAIVTAYSLSELLTSGIDITYIISTKLMFNQVGGTIYSGTSSQPEYDSFGASVSMNAAGTRVAIGAPYNPHSGYNGTPGNTPPGSHPNGCTRVYEYHAGTWVQLGDIIDGKSNNAWSGYSISMNDAGTRVAIGAFQDNNGYGSTYVYEYSGSAWLQIGYFGINVGVSMKYFGFSVSMNAAGTRIAIGAIYNQDGLENSGSTRVYEYNEGTHTWGQIGNTIVGKHREYVAGYSVSMNADGTRVAIGATGMNGFQYAYGGQQTPDHYGNGSTCIYEYNGSGWAQLGSEINGESGNSNNLPYVAVSMNRNGSRVAIGGSTNTTGSNAGQTRMYEYNGSVWVQLGSTIFGGYAGDFSGQSVSMNSDGTIVAIGTSSNAHVYKYYESKWIKLTDDIQGYSWAVSMNDDCTRIAIGNLNRPDKQWSELSPTNSGLPGKAIVYEYGTPSASNLYATGYTATQLKTAGFTSTDLKVTGYTLKQLVDAGYSATELKTAGYSASDLKTAGFTAIQLKTGGYTASDLNDAGYTLNQLVDTGYTASDIKSAGYTLNQLVDAKFTATDLKAAGYAASDLKSVGYTAFQLNNAKFDQASIVAVYSLSELLTSGIDITYIISTKHVFNKLGKDIDGAAANDYSGYSTSMNDAGTRVAIGATGNDGNGSNSGSTRVYEYNNVTNAWIQLGAAINGEAANDQSGYSVSMNSAGSRVAIGAIYNGGNGTYSGSTRVYEYNSGTNTWVKIGQDIDGKAANDQSGYSVSMNSTGNIIAIGAIYYNHVAGHNSGSTCVYEYSAGAHIWIQLSNDILGEDSGDYSGWSVSMNAAGTIVAIGAINNNNVNGIYSGSTRVYQYQQGLYGSWYGYQWVKLGGDIDGEAAGDESGISVSMNSTGSRVAVGAIYNSGNGYNSGSTRVYEYNGYTWYKIGSDIDGAAAGDYSGHSVSMNDAGTRVAIGAIGNDGNGSNSGSTGVYEYNGSNVWVKLGAADIDGEAVADYSGSSVSMNSDGTRVAIGAIYNDGSHSNAGSTRVYEYGLASASTLKVAGYSATELKAAGFTATQLVVDGYTLYDLKNAGYTLVELKEAGYTIQELRILYTLRQLADAFGLAQLHPEFSFKELNNEFTLGELAHVFDLAQLHPEFTVTQLNSEFTLQTLANTFGLAQLHPEFTFTQLNNEFTLQTLADTFGLDKLYPEFSFGELNNEFTLVELAHTFGLDQLHLEFSFRDLNGEFTLVDLNESFSLNELHLEFSLKELNGEFTLVDLSESFSLDQLHLEFSLKELNGEFTLVDLSRSFTLDQLDFEFSFPELNGEFTLTDLSKTFTLNQLNTELTAKELNGEFTLHQLTEMLSAETILLDFALPELHTEHTLKELAVIFGMDALKDAFPYDVLRTEFTEAELM